MKTIFILIMIVPFGVDMYQRPHDLSCLDGGPGERRFRNPLHSIFKSRLRSFEDRDEADYFTPEAMV